MLRQQDRVAVVTGGARGIGAATCRRLAEDGAYVVVLDLRPEDAAAVAATLPHGGHGVGCDITDRARVEEVVRDIDERFGRIDVLVNNAGITNDAMFYKMTPEAWQAVIDVNLTGTFNITQAVAEVMVRNRYGRITFVSSRAALGNRGQTNYSATKAAVIGLSKTLAIELGPFGITSNAVGPGFIETEMTRAIVERTGQSWDDLTGAMRERAAVKRTGLPEDIAAALAYFSLPEAGFTTGQAIFVTGSPAA